MVHESQTPLVIMPPCLSTKKQQTHSPIHSPQNFELQRSLLPAFDSFIPTFWIQLAALPPLENVFPPPSHNHLISRQALN